MRIVVISDSHKRQGNIFDIIEKHMDSTDLFVFLGDVDDDFDSVLMLYPDIKYKRVVGNNDFYSPYKVEDEFTFNGKKVFITHGHKYMVKHGYATIISHAKNIGADICLFGHTHVQYSEYINGLYVLNPGAARYGEYAMIDVTNQGIMMILCKL